MHELRDVETVIRVECFLMGIPAFAIFIVAVYILGGAACVKADTDVIENVHNEQLAGRGIVTAMLKDI